MTRADVGVRWAGPDDVPAVVAFWRRQFGPGSVQAVPGRAEWLFAGQPGGPRIAMATTADGAVVAACGHVVQRVEVPGLGMREAAFGLDFMVDPAFRRQGLGARMLDLRLARFPLSLSTGQSAQMAALYRSRDALDLGSFRLALFRRTVDLTSGPRGVLREVVAVMRGCRGPRVDGHRGHPVDDLPLDDAERAWLAWRFDGPVYRDYRIEQLDGNRGPAVLVTRMQGRREVLVHLGSVPDRTAALAMAARSCATGRLDALFCGQRLAGEFAAAGFLVRPHDARLIGFTSDPDLQAALQRGSIDLFAGSADADLLRTPPI